MKRLQWDTRKNVMFQGSCFGVKLHAKIFNLRFTSEVDSCVIPPSAQLHANLHICVSRLNISDGTTL